MFTIRRDRGNEPPSSDDHRRIEVHSRDILVYRGMEIDQDVLEVLLSGNQRMLWAFVRNPKTGDIMMTPYSEEHVIWLTEDDVATEDEVEL